MNAQKLAVKIGLLKERKCNYKLPIIEIDGIKNIICKIEIWEKLEGLSFYVYCNFKCCDGGDNEILFEKPLYRNDKKITNEDLLKFSEELLDKLPKLRLDIDGRLSQTDIEEQLMLAEFEDIFSSIECDTFKIDKNNTCCVCYEKTNTKTLCEHSLCNRCWSKIEINNDEDEKNIPCPLCRENIYYA